MARTRQGTALTSAHQRQQLGLRAATIRDIIKLYPMWDPFDRASYERFIDTIYLLAQERGRNSAALAARYYTMYRTVETGLTWGKAMAIAEPPSRQAIAAAVNATAVAGFWRGLGNGMTTAEAMKNALVQLSGGVTRNVLNSGRGTLLGAIEQDPLAHGFARVTDGDPCDFCAMLASRGGVYKENTVLFTKSGRRFHDHCCCGTEPVFDRERLPAENLRLHDLWDRAKTERQDGETTAQAFSRLRQVGGETRSGTGGAFRLFAAKR